MKSPGGASNSLEPLGVASALWRQTHPAAAKTRATGLGCASARPADYSNWQRRGQPGNGPRFCKLRNEANCSVRFTMNSMRQIEANRRNALKSTGPTTPRGQDAFALPTQYGTALPPRPS